jgi:hypothetical protein
MMGKNVLRFLAALACAGLLGAAPRHVQTADYFGGYHGTKAVPATFAAQYLTWAETDQPGSLALSALGVKAFLYSNPNIESAVDPMYRVDESAFFHGCDGQRIYIHDARGFAIMNPGSPALLHAWRQYVQRRSVGANFAAVFEDQAIFPSVYRVADPCNYNPQQWLAQLIQAQRNLGYPVIYNGLSDYHNHGVALEIALNATAIGGMMEQCYATSPPSTRAAGWQWTATQDTEIRMASERKYFFCLGNDTTHADRAYDSRIYVDASFLMTYDPRTSVLMEFYHTPSQFHVLPESEIVPLNPVRKKVSAIADLRQNGGAYVREYRNCFLAGRAQGACAVAVNPDPSNTAALSLRGYSHVVTLQGTDVYDGGKVLLVQQQPPSRLGPLQAVIAFR